MNYLSVSRFKYKNSYVANILFITGLAVVIFSVVHSGTANADPVQPFYGAPYYDNDTYVNDGHSQTVDGQVKNNWFAYQQYWGVSPYGSLSCSYTFAPTANGPSAGNFGHITYTGQCTGGNSVFGTLQCPSGYKLVGTTCEGDKELSIVPSSPVIPAGSGVVNNHIQTKSNLKLTVTENEQPDTYESVTLKSDRASADQIVGPDSTDSNGNAAAIVSTRDQPGTSTITSATADISTAEPGVINWLPAKYEGPFEITCYGVAQESLDTTGPMITIHGLPGQYHKGFYEEARSSF
ncbi:MAG: hypothetical protein ACRESU_09440 [Gammaproteobacteria bacterium]